MPYGAVKANMDLRRYELATVAAAKRLRSSYCTLAHGSVLLDKFPSPDDLRAVLGARDTGALDSVDTAVVEFADRLALDASSVTRADVDRLRALGLTDTEILDVVVAAAVRWSVDPLSLRERFASQSESPRATRIR